MKKTVYRCLLMVLFLQSCSNASEDDLIEPVADIDTVTYIDDVKNIIDTNCVICHANPPINGAPMSLTTFNDVKLAIENRNLFERISTQDLGSVMPPGGPRLPQNLIDIINQWEIDGLLEQ